jgi:hypothetical protein
MGDRDGDAIGRRAETITALLAAAVLAGDLSTARALAADLVVLLGVGAPGFEALRAAQFDPVGNAEIAAMIGESKQNTRYIMDRDVHPDAPEPVVLERGKVWPRHAVVRYLLLVGREVSWGDGPEPPGCANC